jgi:trehalose 6-phosphate phosphatase
MVVQADRLSYPRHVSEQVDLLARALGEARHVFLFADYGGTLVPRSRDPEIRPDPDLLRRLDQLSQVDTFSVYVVSGKTVEELDSLMGIDGIGLVGQRGFEIRKADGPMVHPVEPGTAGRLLQCLELDAHGHLGDRPGVVLENRGFALALRLCACSRETARDSTQCFASLVRSRDELGQLELLYGDDVVEAQITGWHKGNAVCHILRDVDAAESLAVYIGDDVTDEDAFEALDMWSDGASLGAPWLVGDPGDEDEPAVSALSILVTSAPRPTLASLFVRDPQEVYEFLSSLAAIATALL